MRHVYQDQTIGGADILNSLADVNINNPEDGQMLVYDASTQRWRNVTQKSLNDLAEVTDLTNVIATGSTNATGATIPKGLYFYLNDDLCQAKVDIADGATFTLNTNYEVVTAGGLNSLNSALANIPILKSSDYDTGSVQITRDSSTDMYYGTVNVEAPADASYAVGVCWANTSWNACAIGVVSNPYTSDNKKLFMVWFASSKSMTIPSRRIRIWYI